MGTIQTTAGSLKSILCFIDPTNTPKIAYDNDAYSEPLINRLKETIGDKDGSQSVFLTFRNDEEELKRQFNGICKNIKGIMDNLEWFTK